MALALGLHWQGSHLASRIPAQMVSALSGAILNVCVLAGAGFGGMMGFMPGMPGLPGAMPGMPGAMNPLGLSGMRAGEKDPVWNWSI